MALDHYIPKCLTRPWHDKSIGKESLRVFSFQTRRFEHKNSGKLFARRRLNSRAVEDYLNEYIENPFSIAQDRMVAAAGNMSAIQAAFSELPHTALTGIYWLQLQRIEESRETSPTGFLADFVSKGISWLEEFSAYSLSCFVPLLFSVPSALYFPDTAIFPIPLVGRRPAYGMPIHTGLALVFAEKTTDFSLIEEWLNKDWVATSLSIGLTASRIVVPPQAPNPTVSTLIRARANNRALFAAIAEKGRLAGLSSWKLVD